MELDLQNLYKTEIMITKNSDILITLNSKFSLDEAKFINKIKTWQKI